MGTFPLSFLPSSSYTHTHTHTGLMFCFISLVVRQIWQYRETDGDSFKENINDSVRRQKKETDNLYEALWPLVLQAFPQLFQRKWVTWNKKFNLTFCFDITLYLFYRRSERRKEVRGSNVDTPISIFPSLPVEILHRRKVEWDRKGSPLPCPSWLNN